MPAPAFSEDVPALAVIEARIAAATERPLIISPGRTLDEGGHLGGRHGAESGR